MTRFNDVQLAFLLGFSYGCSRMRIELQHEAEERINRLSKELRHKADEMIDLHNAEFDAVMQAKFARLDAEFARLDAMLACLQAIERDFDTKRDEDARLN